MNKLRLVLVLVLLAVGGHAQADFVINNTSLPPTKTNLTPIPVGADPTKYLQASDYNSLMNAALDLRGGLMNGTMIGLTSQGSTPNPATPHSPYSIFVRDSDKELIYNKNGSLFDITGTIQTTYNNTPQFAPGVGPPYRGVLMDLSSSKGGLYIRDSNPTGPGDLLDILSSDDLQQWFDVYNGGFGSFIQQDYSSGPPGGFMTLSNGMSSTALVTGQASPDIGLSGTAWDGTASRVAGMLMWVDANITGGTDWDAQLNFAVRHRNTQEVVLQLLHNGTRRLAFVNGELQIDDREEFLDSSATVSDPNTGAIRYNDGVGHLQFSENGGAWTNFGSGGGGSTGNWTFSGNNADLTGAAAMGIGPTTATEVDLGSGTIDTHVKGWLKLDLAAGHLVATAAGAGVADFSNWTGNFKTTTGNITVGGTGKTTYNGGGVVQVVSKSTTYTAGAADYTILVTAVASSFTISLPCASTAGTVYVIKDMSGAADVTHVITVQGLAGACNVDGAAGGAIINTAYGKLGFISDGTNYGTL